MAKPNNWEQSEYDLMISSIGMSDTDPISGATFLFSPSGVNLDAKDGNLLKILNSAKHLVEKTEITSKIREVFKLAIEEGLIFPISYTTNIHYYSKTVSLNISDPFSESIRIWQVRLNN